MCNAPRMLLVGMALTLSACASRVWIADWKETAAINTPRAGAASVLIKDKIYLIGGANSSVNFLGSTEYAQIQKDGSLGPWQFGPRLNEERGFIDAVVHGGYVYVLGGGNGPHGKNYLSSVERARILADGTLAPWEKEKNEMVVARRCNKVLITDQAIYAFGGYTGVFLDSVEYAEWQPDGSLGAWQLDAQVMTVPRYINNVEKKGDIFFVVGGHDETNGAGIADIEWSRPAADGSLQQWQATRPMQQERYGLATAVYGDYLYALGGLSGATYLDSIERARVGKDGQLGPWQYTANLDQPRTTFSAIDYNERLYVIGGASPDGYLSSVVYTERNVAGDIGYWGSEEEARAAAHLAGRKATKLQLPNQGIVKEVLQARAYTYVQVENKKAGLIWLAGPKIADLQPGDLLGYNHGSNMSHFFSRELQRNFPLVLFVSKIQKQ